MAVEGDPVMAEPGATVAAQGMTITCPAGWRDASMLILTAEQPGRSGVTPTVVITREVVPDDFPTDPEERLRAFVDRQIEKMRASLPGFEEFANRPASGDRPTAQLRIGWVSDDVPVTQSLVYAWEDGETIMTSTASAGRNDFAGLEPSFRSMLQSFRTA